MGVGYLGSGNYPAALRALLEAERLDPKNAFIQNYLAIAYYVRGHFVEAEIHLNRALTLNPDYTEARDNLGRLYVDLGRVDEAIQILKLVVNDLTYVTPEKGFYNLGLAYTRRGDDLDAMTQLEHALKAKRDFCVAKQLYGQVLYRLDAYRKSIDTLESTLKLCPGNQDETEYFLGLDHFKLGESALASESLNQMISQHPRSPYVARARSTLKLLR